MEDVGVEVELKLTVDAAGLAAAAAVVEAAGGQLESRALDATYFDTPALDLRREGLSLRIRRSGDRRVQTVKAEAASLGALFARSEWEMPVEDDRPVLDARAGPIGTLIGEERLAKLRPAFTVRVTRRVAELDHAGARIEVVLDEGTVRAGAGESAVAEVELELLSGSPAALFALARALDEAAPAWIGMLSKSERGYRLLDGSADRPEKAAPGLRAGTLSAGDAFARIAAACLRQFRVNEDLLARSRDAGALHQARVALRRLRSALAIFRTVAGDNRYEHLRVELRWLAATLGEARDLDVLIARTGERPELRGPRERAYDAVAGALGSPRARRLMLDLAEWLAVGAWRTAPADPAAVDRPAALFAARALDRLRRRVKRRGGGLDELDDEARHRVRIAAKQLRYAAEFFAGLFAGGKARRRARRFLAAVEALQTHLGELNDLATAPVLAARLGLPAPDAPDPAQRRRLIRRAADAHDELVDAKRFWR